MSGRSRTRWRWAASRPLVERRRSAGAPQPAGELSRGVAGDRPAERPLGVTAAATIGPHDARADRCAVLVDGNSARPLAGDAHGTNLVGAHDPGGESGAEHGEDHCPPLAGILLVGVGGGSPCLQHVVVGPGDLPRERDQPHLEARRTEVDRDRVAVLAGRSSVFTMASVIRWRVRPVQAPRARLLARLASRRACRSSRRG